MRKSANDLIVMLTARPIALSLIILLAYKLYSLNPSSLGYTIGLITITVLFAMRWCIHLIAHNKLMFLDIYKTEYKSSKE